MAKQFCQMGFPTATLLRKRSEKHVSNCHQTVIAQWYGQEGACNRYFFSTPQTC